MQKVFFLKKQVGPLRGIMRVVHLQTNEPACGWMNSQASGGLKSKSVKGLLAVPLTISCPARPQVSAWRPDQREDSRQRQPFDQGFP